MSLRSREGCAILVYGRDFRLELAHVLVAHTEEAAAPRLAGAPAADAICLTMEGVAAFPSAGPAGVGNTPPGVLPRCIRAPAPLRAAHHTNSIVVAGARFAAASAVDAVNRSSRLSAWKETTHATSICRACLHKAGIGICISAYIQALIIPVPIASCGICCIHWHGRGRLQFRSNSFRHIPLQPADSATAFEPIMVGAAESAFTFSLKR